ncbi:MAG TPA: RsmB/NOP family class I SAM-dependent RNA methyltransferase [Burkholderiales bacterium]|nr:RsmB/NOP family class I SAM-dependent RNA methyltransferase [Burkholderiales bacterium]
MRPANRHQLEAAAEALEQVLEVDRPADAVLHRFFGERRGLGSHDRAFVAETVFGVLRHKRLLDRLAPNASLRLTVLAYLARPGGASVRELAPLLRGDEAAVLGRVKSVPIDDLPLGIRAELPDWVIERLQARLSDAEVLELGRALQQPAPLDLRVNPLRASRDQLLRDLAASGIAAQPTPYSPLGMRLREKPAINRHPRFLDGSIEVQDEGSQILGYLVAPRRGELVVDFCAGAGGKALMLGALMHSQGRVYAFDVSARRLARLNPRLKRSGLSNLHPAVIVSENDTRVKRLAGRIDRVLVDAPCSGLGTLRRNPDLKWRQSPESVAELTRKQAAILGAAAKLVKPGGRLVYATCSLLCEENEAIVQAFLAERTDFQLLDCAALLRAQRIPLDTGEHLALLTHRHGTDGFFAAAMARNE